MIRVSTKMEQVWYIDPDLMAAEDEPSSLGPIESSKPAQPDPTLNLGESDLEDLLHVSEGDLQDEARHYRDVSLRGALLVSDVASDEPELDINGTLAWATQVSPAALALLFFLAGVSTTLVGVLIVL